MLTIKRRHTAIKAITAGSVAFAIGLTGATAFIGDNFQAETPIFNKEQNATNSNESPLPVSDGTSSAAGTSGSDGSDMTTGGTATQSAGSGFAPAPTEGTTAPISPTQSLTQPTSGTTNTTEATSPTGGTSPTTGGIGGGSLLDPVTNLIQETCVTSCLQP